VNRSKLDDEDRQAAIVDILVEGWSLAKAAQAAAVTTATLQRSSRLRMAASVAPHGELQAPQDATDDGNRACARSR
jgi:hypothetical protein